MLNKEQIENWNKDNTEPTKKDTWEITSNAVITELVNFEEPVTKERAEFLYLRGEYESVIDSDLPEVEDVIWVK